MNLPFKEQSATIVAELETVSIHFASGHYMSVTELGEYISYLTELHSVAKKVLAAVLGKQEA